MLRSRGKRRAGGLTSALLAVVVLALPVAADARPRLAGVFDLSGRPQHITPGPDGNIWVTLTDSSDSNSLARIKPNGNVKEYQDTEIVNPFGIKSGPDGNLWLTRNGGVIRVPPNDPSQAEAFDINAISAAQEIVRGPGGKLWTASADQLVSFLPADPNGFDATTIDGMGARGIANSGDRLWIADFGGGTEGKIIRAAPGGGVKRFNVGGGPQDVARGPKKSVAYTNQSSDPQTVGRIFPGKPVRKSRVPNTDPFGITFGPDRRWWVANFLSHDLTILTRDGETRRFRKLPDNSGPRYLTGGPNNTIWVSLETSHQVARIKGVRKR